MDLRDQSLTREERIELLLKKVVDFRREELGAEIRSAEVKRYLVVEYDSDDIMWFYTVDSLDAAEKEIDSRTSRDVGVYDLDDGSEFRVEFSSKVIRP